MRCSLDIVFCRFPQSPQSSLQQSNHRHVLEEDSLAIRPASLFFFTTPSSTSFLPAVLPHTRLTSVSSSSSSVWFIRLGWRQWPLWVEDGKKERRGRTVSLAPPLAPFSPLGCVWVNTLQARDYKQPPPSLGSPYLGTTANEGWPLGPYTVHCVDMSISMKIKEKETSSEEGDVLWEALNFTHLSRW